MHFVTESANEQAWVYQRDLKEKLLDKLHVNLAQGVHIGLDGICEINQQIWSFAV